MAKSRKQRLHERNEQLTKRFNQLCEQRTPGGKQKLSNEAIIEQLADEFPPLAESTIEKIIKGQVKYKGDD